MLKNSITPEEWKALKPEVQAEYKEAGDGYELQHDDVLKIKASLDRKDVQLRDKDKRVAELEASVRELNQRFDGLDPEAAREALRKQEQQQGKELVDKGQFDAALEREREKHKREIEDRDKKFASERDFTSSLLIDRELRRLFTAGEGPDGAIPTIEKGLVDGAEAYFRAKYQPKVVEEGDKRKAVATADGIDRDLDTAVADWLTSEAAKPWVVAPVNEGGHQAGVRTGSSTTTKAGVKVVPRSEADRYIEDIAAGKVEVAPA